MNNNSYGDNRDVNSKNQEEFNHLIENARKKDDGYLDRNNPIIKFTLIALLIIALGGSIYFIILWYLNK